MSKKYSLDKQIKDDISILNIIDEGKATAEKLKEGIVNEAKEEAEAIIAKARADSEAERDRISSEIKSEVADLSLEMSDK